MGICEREAKLIEIQKAYLMMNGQYAKQNFERGYDVVKEINFLRSTSLAITFPKTKEELKTMELLEDKFKKTL